MVEFTPFKTIILEYTHKIDFKKRKKQQQKEAVFQTPILEYTNKYTPKIDTIF